MIEPFALPGEGRRHGGAIGGEDDALEQGVRSDPVLGAAGPGAFPKDGVDGVPKVMVDDGFVLTGVGCALVDGFTQIDAVVDELVDEALVDLLAALVENPFDLQCPRQRGGGAQRREAFKYHSDGLGLGLIDHQLPVLDVIAYGDTAAHPHAALAGSRELVANAFSDDFPFELGEAQEDVQGKPPHRSGGVEGLGDRDEGHAVPVEDLDQLGEVHQGAAQAIDLVNDDHVDQPHLNVLD